MKLKSHSLMLGYREWEGKLERRGKNIVLVLQGLGAISPTDYMKNGFRVLDGRRNELEGLVEGGYESRRALLRLYS